MVLELNSRVRAKHVGPQGVLGRKWLRARQCACIPRTRSDWSVQLQDRTGGADFCEYVVTKPLISVTFSGASVVNLHDIIVTMPKM